MLFPPFRQKKKLVTDKDGNLHYPHNFIVGQMVKFKRGYENLNGITGFGIITEIIDDSVTIFWQNTSEYKTYTIASAILTFMLVESK